MSDVIREGLERTIRAEKERYAKSVFETAELRAALIEILDVVDVRTAKVIARRALEKIK